MQRHGASFSLLSHNNYKWHYNLEYLWLLVLVMSSFAAVATKRALSSTAASVSRPVLRGVVFDMDGTLTVPNLDFNEMYARCGVPMSEDLLTAIAVMSESNRAEANRHIEDMEAEAARTMVLAKVFFSI